MNENIRKLVEREAREFWVIVYEHGHYYENHAKAAFDFEVAESFHVIEYSALEKLHDYYAPKLKKAIEALETLKVAVNDKVDDPGATRFIMKALAELSEVIE